MSTVTNHTRLLSSHLDPTRQAYPVLRRRHLGSTGISVGEIGLGTAALAAEGLLAIPDAEIRYTLGVALDMQVTLVDAAVDPREDRILRQLGFVLQGRRAHTVLCLRVSGDAAELRRRAELALRLTDAGHIDVLLWDHPAFQSLHAADAGWAALAALKREGKARAVGASLDRPEELRAAMEQTPAEVLQFPLNVLDQSNAVVLDAAVDKGLGLIAVKPLDSGWLTGRYGAHHIFLDARRRWSGHAKARRAELQEAFEAIVSKSGTTATQAALQFTLGYPQVACAVVGVSAWQQVVGNVDAASARLDPGMAEKLRSLWADRLEASPLGL